MRLQNCCNRVLFSGLFIISATWSSVEICWASSSPSFTFSHSKKSLILCDDVSQDSMITSEQHGCPLLALESHQNELWTGIICLFKWLPEMLPMLLRFQLQLRKWQLQIVRLFHVTAPPAYTVTTPEVDWPALSHPEEYVSLKNCNGYSSYNLNTIFTLLTYLVEWLSRDLDRKRTDNERSGRVPTIRYI